MMRSLRVWIILLLCSPVFFSQCNPSANRKGEGGYKEKIRQWRDTRLKNLKSPEGWLNLAGLYWLETGPNTLGSDSTMDVVFPGKAPARLGTLHLSNGHIRFSPHQDVAILHDGDTLTGGTTLKSDAEGNPDKLSHGSLKWFVIKRGDRYGIRLRDLESPLLEKVDHIPAYPVKPDWRIRARFVPYNQPQYIEVPNVLGGTYQDQTPGKLQFTYNDKQYTLHPTGTRENLFVVFGDDTNAEETYGGGRFLVVDGAGQDNITFLDFNKAYNPPCAFTPYATCPLPPRKNILPFKVKAGEKTPDIDVPHGH